MSDTSKPEEAAAPSTVPVGMKILLRIEDAAAVLSVSVRTLRTLVDQGMIPVVRIGTRVLFRRAGLETWAEQQEKICEEPECPASLNGEMVDS